MRTHVFIELKKSPFVLVERSSSLRKSILPVGLMKRTRLSAARKKQLESSGFLTEVPLQPILRLQSRPAPRTVTFWWRAMPRMDRVAGRII